MSYERPILARYTDPLELVWMATARRLGLTIRRNPHIFSMTNGEGLLELGPRDSLDPDDNAAQMILHELCHWVVNGAESFSAWDWGFPATDEDDWREFACLRLQAHVADRIGSRAMFGVTGKYRAYYDRIPEDVLAPLDDSPWEARIVARAREAIGEIEGPPWGEPVGAAIAATRALRESVAPFLDSYQTDLDADDLPSLWSR